MLVNTIHFEIHNFQTSVSEKFVVIDSIENQEMILAHHYTRNIQFVQMFNFQFEKEMSIPTEMISMDTWMLMLNVNPELIAPVAELELV